MLTINLKMKRLKNALFYKPASISEVKLNGLVFDAFVYLYTIVM